LINLDLESHVRFKLFRNQYKVSSVRDALKSKKQILLKDLDSSQSESQQEAKLPGTRKTRPSILYKRINSSNELIEYFGDDETDKINRRRINDDYFYHESTVNFSMKQYLEFFIIHLLAYSILGPFINLYSLFVRKNKALMKNLMFIGCFPSFFIQHGFWLVNMFLFSVWAWSDNAITIADMPAIVATILHQILRASSIAGKYATFPPNLIKKIKRRKMRFWEIMRELMLVGWLSQPKSLCEDEIDNAMKRLEIDNTMFKIAFITDISRKTIQRFKDIPKNYSPGFFENLTLDNRDKSQTIYYDGKLVFAFLLEEFNERYNIKAFSILRAGLICLGFSIAPGIIRVAFSQPFHGIGTLEISIFYLNTIVSFLAMLSIVLFLDRALTDLGRRNFMLQQLGQSISPKKMTNYSGEKHLPTIHLFDQITLRSWEMLRKLSITYGSKFLFRHEIMMPVIMIIATLSIAATMILHYLLHIENKEVQIEIWKLEIFLLFVFGVFFSNFFGLLYVGASVNSHFQIHMYILNLNKQLYNDIYIFKDIYFNQQFEELKSVRRKRSIYSMGKIIKEKGSSFVHRKMARLILILLGDSVGLLLEPFLLEMIGLCETITEGLSEEEQFNAMQFLGFTVTRGAINNFVLAYVSVLATSLEFLSS